MEDEQFGGFMRNDGQELLIGRVIRLAKCLIRTGRSVGILHGQKTKTKVQKRVIVLVSNDV